MSISTGSRSRRRIHCRLLPWRPPSRAHLPVGQHFCEQDQMSALDDAWTGHLHAADVGQFGTLPQASRMALREERAFQSKFRRLVLSAQCKFCSICKLDIESILGAAHLISHASDGRPTEENGRPLCANHHRDFGRDCLFWQYRRRPLNGKIPDRGSELLNSSAARLIIREYYAISVS